MVETLTQKTFHSISMKLLAGVAFFFILPLQTEAQIFTEDFGFGTCADQGTLATDAGLGWSETELIVHTPAANEWYVSPTEGGGYDPDIDPCGERCSANPGLINNSLHIGDPTPFDGGVPPDLGAIYEGGPATNQYNTNRRIESPVIDVSGVWNMELNFRYAAGQNVSDRATIVYYNGTIWQDIEALPQTPTCSATSIEWVNYTVLIPNDASNILDFQFGFRWENNSDGNDTPFNVSVAIDDIELYAGTPPTAPVADFSVEGGNDPFCENNCITFNDETDFDPNFSTAPTGVTYAWVFEGGNPATSSDQNPVVCYDDPGTYDVTLTVTDNIGPSAPVTMVDFIEVLDCGPVVDFSVSNTTPCANEQCVDFTDLSVPQMGDMQSWLWTFTSASGADVQTSTDQNPAGICLNEVGFYDVSLEASDEGGVEILTMTNMIEVLDCSGPDIDFTIDRSVICPGQCVELTDMSTSNGTITAWNWDLPGGQAEGETMPGMSTQQNPVVCYDTPGTYNITLSATDEEGPSAITKTIQITVDPCTGPPDAGIGASETDICAGDCVDFQSQSLGLVEEYLWVFQGIEDVNDITSTEQNPSVVCYPNPGVYDVTLTVSNSNGEVDSQVFTDFITVNSCINPPVPRIEVGSDTICAGKCVDYFSVSTGIGISAWEWNFQGADIGSQTSTLENPTNICYSQGGTFDVSLKVTGAAGDSTIIFQDAIVVETTSDCRPTIEPMIPDTICAGDCATFEAIFADADSVRWTFQGGNPATSTAFSPGLVCFNEVGNYMIMIEAWNPSGAAFPVIEEIFVGERPPLNAGPDLTINSGAVIQLTASLGGLTPIGDFLWQPFELVDDFTAQTVTTSPLESTTFIVYYQEPLGCQANDTIKVNVNYVEAVGVPSAFTPNGDGVNDQLRVLGQGIARMNFKVFNRYGQLVFETDDQSEGWDGRKNGKELNPGTFAYTLEVNFAEGASQVFKGNVTLVR